MNSNMDSNLTESTLNTINHLDGRIQYLERQIEYLQASNAYLQETNANLLAYNNYLCSRLASSPNPNTVPTVPEDGERSDKRLREESSDELRVSEPLEQSPFVGNSDGFASYEETNSLLEDYPYDENDGFWDFVRNLYEESHPEENSFSTDEQQCSLGEEQLYLQPADE